jgi:predicted homoserine dehydrogenase-like protein
VCEVVTVAKRDLKTGERLDGIGGFCAYGLIENRTAARAGAAVPIGLSERGVLRRDVKKDQVISFADVEVRTGELAGLLWQAQNERWPVAAAGHARAVAYA